MILALYPSFSGFFLYNRWRDHVRAILQKQFRKIYDILAIQLKNWLQLSASALAPFFSIISLDLIPPVICTHRGFPYLIFHISVFWGGLKGFWKSRRGIWLYLSTCVLWSTTQLLESERSHVYLDCRPRLYKQQVLSCLKYVYIGAGACEGCFRTNC